jgi:hypothetical protein
MSPDGKATMSVKDWTRSGEFRFERLDIAGIDNGPVASFFGPDILRPEVCLLHRNFSGGDQYLGFLRQRILEGMEKRVGLPVVRFADGEYAFYDLSLECNGLYEQAESVQAIRNSLPVHIENLRFVAERGVLAPVIYPENTTCRKGFWPLLRKSGHDDSAERFLEFLLSNGISFDGSNYVPFFAVYAYLASRSFAMDVDGKKVCILNSEWDPQACGDWFKGFSSAPELSFVRIPPSYVATRWSSIREGVLGDIPPDADLCFVGAGVGALHICADIARRFSIPAVDAGHVLNMMNGMVDKSKGPRLYTIYR